MMAGFAFWLQRNGHLIKDLVLDYNQQVGQGACRAAETMLSFAFSSAASFGKRLRMRGAVIVHGLVSPGMITSLPSSNLRALSVRNVTLTDLQQRSVASSMQQLTALETLEVRLTYDFAVGGMDGEGSVEEVVPARFLPALQGLSSLRTVALTGFNCTSPSLQCLPPSIQKLKIFELTSRVIMLDIPQLTCLQELSVLAAGGITEGSALPPSVPVVSFLNTPLPADPCRLLAGVQQLDMITGCHVQPADVLVELSALTSLTQLSIGYTSAESAAAAAPAWRHLQQLRSLEVSMVRMGPREQYQYQAVLEGIEKAGQLTSLILRLSVYTLPLPWGENIAQLRNLQQLVVEQGNAVRQDMLHLRALTQLTELKLYFASMDDGTAAAVLTQLTNLRSLSLNQEVENAEHGQMSDAVLPALAQLKGLRDLKLELPGVNESSLPLLEGLTQLTQLEVGLCQQSLEHLARVLRCKVCPPSGEDI